jgi:uncharacterized membrane protein
LGLAALLVGACQPPARDDAAPRRSPPAPAPTAETVERGPPPPPAFQGEFEVLGTEPFWMVSIKPGAITVARPDQPLLKAPNHGPRMAGNQAVWASQAGEEPLIVAMVEQECSDGMSDTIYPYAAEVQIEGDLHSGCGRRPKGG